MTHAPQHPRKQELWCHIILLGCGIARVGPRQHPQYARALSRGACRWLTLWQHRAVRDHVWELHRAGKAKSAHIFCVVHSIISTVRGFSSTNSDQGYAQCGNLRPTLASTRHSHVLSICAQCRFFFAHPVLTVPSVVVPWTVHSPSTPKGTLKIARTRANACSHCG